MKFKVGDSGDFISKAVGTKVLQHKNQVSLADLKSHGKPVVLLVDADIYAYRCSATTDGRKYTVTHEKETEDGMTQTDTFEYAYKKTAVEYCEAHGLDPKECIEQTFHPEPEKKAFANIDKTMRGMKKDLTAHRMECYLTPDILFRHDHMSDYKKNRDGMRKPHNLKACKEYYQKYYHAEKVDGYEADDLLAIRARQLIAEGKFTPVIVSLDKDLDMISCYHYNTTKKCIYFVTPEEGTLAFYTQLITGDKTDNIPGIHGVGPKGAENILKDCDGSSSFDCYSAVLQAYLNHVPQEEGETDDDFAKRIVTTVTRNARLLYILHNAGELWVPPVAPLKEDDGDADTV